MPDLILIPKIVVAGLTGAVLHELTHWAVARVQGRTATVDWWQLETYYEDTGRPDDFIRIAPLCFGSWVVLPVLFLNMSLPLLAFWAIYTLGGIQNDLDGMPIRSYPS